MESCFSVKSFPNRHGKVEDDFRLFSKSPTNSKSETFIIRKVEDDSF